MANTFLAVELDALKTAPHVARVAGIAEDTAIAGLLRMWAWCWQEKTDRVAPVAVRGFFGADCAEALTAFGFLEQQSGAADYRVKGAERYLRISAARRRGGEAAKAHLVPGAIHRREPKASPTTPSAGLGLQPKESLGCASALSPNTEHRTPIKEAAAEQPQNATAPPEAGTSSFMDRRAHPRTPQPEDFEPDEEGAFAPTAMGFWGWTQHERQARGLFGEGRPPDHLVTWHDEAVAEVGLDGLALAYVRYLDSGDFRTKGWPLRIFMADAVWRPRASEPAQRVRL